MRQGARPWAAVPSAQIFIVPGLRKKLSPIVDPESPGPVRARFSKVKSPSSGVQVIVGGRPTESEGVMRKSTLLS